MISVHDQLMKVALNTAHAKDKIVMDALKHFGICLLQKDWAKRLKADKKANGEELYYIDGKLVITFKPLRINYGKLRERYEAKMSMEYIEHYKGR